MEEPKLRHSEGGKEEGRKGGRGEGGKRGRRSRMEEEEEAGEGSSSSSGGDRGDRRSGTPYTTASNGRPSSSQNIHKKKESQRSAPQKPTTGIAATGEEKRRRTTSKEAIKAIDDAIKNEENPKGLSTKRKCIFALGAFMVICGVSVALGVGLTQNGNSDYDGYGFNNFAVTSDHGNCSVIGRDILREGGSAVDAAVAAAFCTSVFQPQCSGMGGGLVLVAYKQKTQEVDVIDGLPAVPSNPLERSKQKGAAVAVPGQLAGLWLAHQRHGKLPWNKLVSPTIELLKGGGVTLSKFMLHTLRSRSDLSKIISSSPSLCSILCDEMGQPAILESFRPNFAALLSSLERVAVLGIDYLYRYTFGPATATKTLEIEVKKKGGTLSSNDLTSYNGKIRQPFVKRIDGYTFLAPPLPSFGFVIPTALNLLSHYQLSTMAKKYPHQFYHHVLSALQVVFEEAEKIIIEAKNGKYEWDDIPTYSKLRQDLNHEKQMKKRMETFIKGRTENMRNTSFLDQFEIDLNKNMQCGNNIHVIAQDGDGASLTFGTSSYFGAGFSSNATGIIFNSAMRKVFLNKKTGARLLSSLSSLTVLDETGNLRLQVAGVGGGVAGLTGAVFASYRHLWLKQMPYEATSAPVLVRGISNRNLYYESKTDGSLVRNLRGKGYEMREAPDEFVFGVDMIAKIEKDQKKIYAYADRRKGEDAFASGE